MFFNLGDFKNFAKFTGKHLRKSLYFNKVPGVSPATLFKKRLWHRCFPVTFGKFLRTSFYKTPPVDVSESSMSLSPKKLIHCWRKVTIMFKLGDSMFDESFKQHLGIYTMYPASTLWFFLISFICIVTFIVHFKFSR